jgi:hypothetical protein
MFPLNRVVVLLTPVFGGIAAIALAWAAKHAPGLPLPTQGELTALEIAGFTGAVGMAAHWLHGHQQYEARLDSLEKDAIAVASEVKDADEDAAQPPALNATPVDPGTVAKVIALARAELDALEGEPAAPVQGTPSTPGA